MQSVENKASLSRVLSFLRSDLLRIKRCETRLGKYIFFQKRTRLIVELMRLLVHCFESDSASKIGSKMFKGFWSQFLLLTSSDAAAVGAELNHGAHGARKRQRDPHPVQPFGECL